MRLCALSYAAQAVDSMLLCPVVSPAPPLDWYSGISCHGGDNPKGGQTLHDTVP